MFRLLAFFALASVALASSCIPPNQPNGSGAVVELPAIPVYPKNGKIPPALKDRFVFLDAEDSTKIVVTLVAEDLTRTIVGRMTLNIGVCPSMTLGIKKNGENFEYEYQLTNRAAAQQPLGRWVQPLPFKAAVQVAAAPAGWLGSEVNPDESIQASNAEYLKTVTQLVDADRAKSLPSIRHKLDWFSQMTEYVIAPGASQDFRMRTKASPGIVVTYFEGGPVEVKDMIWGDSNWPPNMLDQVLAFDNTENDSVSVLGVGPKFDPGTNRVAIAKDYFSVIDGAIKQKRLRRSPFLQEAMSRLMSGAANVAPWVSKPVTPLEKQIFLGMGLSLN